MKGRNTPSPGFDAAADYIEKRLQRAGVKPLGDNGSYRQHYVMRESTLAPGSASITIGDRTFAVGDDFALRPFAGELVTSPVGAVYVGHGWTAEGIDPYAGINVKGKIVVVHAMNARPQGAKIQGLGRVTVGGTSPLVEADAPWRVGRRVSRIRRAAARWRRPGQRADGSPRTRSGRALRIRRGANHGASTR